MFVEFVIQNQYFSFPLEDFAQILRIPCEGSCVYSDRWSLDELVYGAPSKERKPRKDRGTRRGRHSTSSSTFNEPSSSHLNDDDDDDGNNKGTSRESCKWIFKRKMKVNGTIDKFKARLVIQGFRQKEGIDYFDTYAPVARITIIRLLLALEAIHNLVIKWINNQNQVDKTKNCLSSKFSMKDIGELDAILGIKFKRENKGIVITQSHYIEKILKKFNREDCSLVSTPMDPIEKLKPNTDKLVDQLEYSRAMGI
nr:retrotransposon protein, putative, Ty1-copia subclass [Tanacetum cinerariifolium]